MLLPTLCDQIRASHIKFKDVNNVLVRVLFILLLSAIVPSDFICNTKYIQI